MRLFIDQYGNHFTAKTVKELKSKHGIPGKVSKMYIDKADGTTVQTGYVIGSHWLTEYAPVEKPVK